MNAPPLLTLPDWAAAYAAGDTPRARLDALRRRLDAERPEGVWIHVVDEAGLDAQISALEQRRARHDDAASADRALPLFGIPFAVKDNIDVAGMPTTAACAAFTRHAETHAHAVARLVEAGAVCMGKTNLDQFATGLVGTRSPFGRPSSTFAADRVSGGSSSGSAVAVSLGLVPFALGTDTAGSGRVPAAFNGVVGLKPTPGRVGTSGVVPACRSLDCVCIFALTAVDAAAVLAAVEGDDPEDAFSAFAAGPASLPATLRVGIPSHAAFFGEAGYGPAFEKAVSHLQSLGHAVVPVDFAPLHAVAAMLYDGPWLAERLAVVETLLASQPEALDPSVRAVVEPARSMSATDAFRSLHALREAQRRSASLWDGADLLMVPTAPGHPRHADVEAEPLSVNAQLGTYTNFVNLLGWCALALPAGTAARGLPFGVTFIARAGWDAALARFGALWQASLDLPLGATGEHRPTHDAADAVHAARWPLSEPTLPLAVVGAHLSGLPLNGQLTALGATLRGAATTAPHYRLFALPGSVPAKPGLLRVARGGAAIAVEVWDLPSAQVGAFLAGVPAPLGIGSLELADGERVHGFVCEAHALEDAADITEHGGWRRYLASLDPSSGAAAPDPVPIKPHWKPA